MSGPRHKWKPFPHRYTWRVIERCAHCGTYRWEVVFDNARGDARRAFLYAKPRTFDPWFGGQPPCTGRST